jgi:hypothetical protein
LKSRNWTHEATSSARIAAVVAGILLVTALHLVMPVSLLHWQNAFQHLYYLPIVFAGLPCDFSATR